MLFHIPLLSFTVPRYLYKQRSGTASCTGTETFILLDEHSLYSLALRYSGFQQVLSRHYALDSDDNIPPMAASIAAFPSTPVVLEQEFR